MVEVKLWKFILHFDIIHWITNLFLPTVHAPICYISRSTIWSQFWNSYIINYCFNNASIIISEIQSTYSYLLYTTINNWFPISFMIISRFGAINYYKIGVCILKILYMIVWCMHNVLCSCDLGTQTSWLCIIYALHMLYAGVTDVRNMLTTNSHASMIYVSSAWRILQIKYTCTLDLASLYKKQILCYLHISV